MGVIPPTIIDNFKKRGIFRTHLNNVVSLGRFYRRWIRRPLLYNIRKIPFCQVFFLKKMQKNTYHSEKQYASPLRTLTLYKIIVL